LPVQILIKKFARIAARKVGNMVLTPEEALIMREARQPKLRNPLRSRDPFSAIFSVFFHDVSFEGQKVIDLGPGQWDFCEVAREKGAECVGVDHDPAVLRLGEHKGFSSVNGDLRKVESFDFGRQNFNGLFNRFSFNSAWFIGMPQAHYEYVQALTQFISPSGWAWMAPWNGRPASRDGEAGAVRALAVQREVFTSLGFEAVDLKPEQIELLGLKGLVLNHILFTKGLSSRW
jgi:hypothetical protein